MPELPEVETIRMFLNEVLMGKKVQQVRHLDSRMVKKGHVSSEEISRRLPGHMVKSLKRRGKFLFLEWDTREHLLLHLGMSGRLLWVFEDEPWAVHTHMILDFGGHHLRLIDPRRFGRIGWIEKGEELLPHLGIEPLSRKLTARELARRLEGRTAPIKSLLLNQSIVAGLGNIYVDESLFRARILPHRAGGSLSEQDTKRLVRAIHTVLKEAIIHGGTSFSDYVDALGHPGKNQDYLQIYGRNITHCPVCTKPVVSQVIQGRTAHFCQYCQR